MNNAIESPRIVPSIDTISVHQQPLIPEKIHEEWFPFSVKGELDNN